MRRARGIAGYHLSISKAHSPAGKTWRDRRRPHGSVTVVLAGLLVLAGAGPSAAGSQASSTTRLPHRELQAQLDQLVAGGMPGAIGLARHRGQVWRGASGVADIGTGRPMRPGDRYKVGSVTKTFTATVVLQLVAERRLRLDDTVERWLPGMVPNGEHITIRQLLSHTSGLFTYDEDPRIFEPYLQGNLDHKWQPHQLVAIATDHPPLFAPGAGWSYSNTGYVLLGLIIQEATGTSLGHQLRARIVRPLGLEHTSSPTTDPRISGRYAHGYLLDDEPDGTPQDITGLSPSWTWATGNMVSTVDDVARFYRALLRGRLLPPDLLRAMQTTVDAGSGLRYGLGLASILLPCGGTVWGHEGGLPGYENWALASGNGNDQVVMAVNAGAGDDAAVVLVLQPTFRALCAVRGTPL